VVTGIDEAKRIHVYPNPSKGNFYLDGTPSQIQITDMAGSPVSFSHQTGYDKTQIQLATVSPGLYVLKYFEGIWHTEKIMVLP
jgi:hypothetical protein